MERMTNSADARRAADYLSRYCNEKRNRRLQGMLCP